MTKHERKWFAAPIMGGNRDRGNAKINEEADLHTPALGKELVLEPRMHVVDDTPALLGGTPVRAQGPPPWPPDEPDLHQALRAALADRSWGTYHGPHIGHLEEALGAFFGVEHVLTCGSGTFAVELALRALKIEAGDEVMLAAYDYPGNFLTVHAVGAQPVLVDVHADNWNLDVRQVPAAIGPRTRAVIASHLHGGVVPMRELTALCSARGIAVIEDAAQCPGAIVQGRKAGTWGDAGVISFGGSKLLSAGRGGALITNRADGFQRARTPNLRGNLVCPLSELQAAVLLPQLAKLDDRNAQRARAVQELSGLLTGVPGVTPFANPTTDTQPGYYKVGFQYDASVFGLHRQR